MEQSPSLQANRFSASQEIPNTAHQEEVNEVDLNLPGRKGLND